MACTSELDWVVGARSGGRDGASLERGGDELISLWFHVAEQLCTVHDTVEKSWRKEAQVRLNAGGGE